LHDTILARWSLNIQPLDEYGVKVLVDNDGNYLLFGYAEFGPLGGNDIFLIKYKKWNPPTPIDSIIVVQPIVNTDFAIYPNPTQNHFTITGLKENSNITIIDVMGKIVYNTTNSTSSIIIPTNLWAKGIYIVQVKSNEEYLVNKIIKQ